MLHVLKKARCKYLGGFLLAVNLAGPAAAQTFEGLTASATQVGVGQPVDFGIIGKPDEKRNWCGLRLQFGDGNHRDFKVVDGNVFPLQYQYRYANPGTYTVTIEPARVTNRWACEGAKQTVIVNVVAQAQTSAPVPAAAVAAAVAPAPAAAAPAAVAPKLAPLVLAPLPAVTSAPAYSGSYTDALASKEEPNKASKDRWPS